MALGDKLYAIVNPRATEARVKKLERDLKRTRHDINQDPPQDLPADTGESSSLGIATLVPFYDASGHLTVSRRLRYDNTGGGIAGQQALVSGGTDPTDYYPGIIGMSHDDDGVRGISVAGAGLRGTGNVGAILQGVASAISATLSGAGGAGTFCISAAAKAAGSVAGLFSADPSGNGIALQLAAAATPHNEDYLQLLDGSLAVIGGINKDGALYGTLAGGGGGGAPGIEFIFDGQGSVLNNGVFGVLRIPAACAITRASLIADVSGDVTLDLKKCAAAGFPGSLASIVASAPPTLAAAQVDDNCPLTGWTTSLAAGDYLQFEVTSASSITRLTLALDVV